jgi:hypothetical protein
MAILRYHDIVGLQIAMDDSGSVGLGQTFGGML